MQNPSLDAKMELAALILERQKILGLKPSVVAQSIQLRQEDWSKCTHPDNKGSYRSIPPVPFFRLFSVLQLTEEERQQWQKLWLKSKGDESLTEAEPAFTINTQDQIPDLAVVKVNLGSGIADLLLQVLTAKRWTTALETRIHDILRQLAVFSGNEVEHNIEFALTLTKAMWHRLRPLAEQFPRPSCIYWVAQVGLTYGKCLHEHADYLQANHVFMDALTLVGGHTEQHTRFNLLHRMLETTEMFRHHDPCAPLPDLEIVLEEARRLLSGNRRVARILVLRHKVRFLLRVLAYGGDPFQLRRAVKELERACSGVEDHFVLSRVYETLSRAYALLCSPYQAWQYLAQSLAHLDGDSFTLREKVMRLRTEALAWASAGKLAEAHHCLGQCYNLSSEYLLRNHTVKIRTCQIEFDRMFPYVANRWHYGSMSQCNIAC